MRLITRIVLFSDFSLALHERAFGIGKARIRYDSGDHTKKESLFHIRCFWPPSGIREKDMRRTLMSFQVRFEDGRDRNWMDGWTDEWMDHSAVYLRS